MEILEYKDSPNKNEVLELLQELRPNLNSKDFNDILCEATKESYKLLTLYNQGELKAIIGFRVIHDFTHKKHIYIDDLVTTMTSRSQGYGKILLDHVEDLAGSLNCNGMRLCSGIDRKAAHNFYEREEWTAKSLAFKKNLFT